jgi:2-polyprenyl-3-methyl-5-hydroxy-6-metoxy-1,4-benzoquinol methylase
MDPEGSEETMNQLVPDRLRELWQQVDRQELTAEEFQAEQERLLDTYRRTWTQALSLDGSSDLEKSLLAELGRYVACDDQEALRARCRRAVDDLRHEWGEGVDRDRRESVERFYDASDTPLYELTLWHTLIDDLSPLAYVVALHYAQRHHCTSYLDFGSGVGSGVILFARHGLAVTAADISGPLLGFCRWRMAQRGLPGTYVDVKTTRLPSEAFDMITAMDVFEHLVDPIDTVEELWRALRPGGFLFGRFGTESDDNHPMHIVEDFEPTFARLRALGGVEVWRDQWLWGHQVFRKAS